ncbi:MAG: HAD-IA family hydrolase [Holosporaceae bacterium]|jgi:HAD superfamily hydrolase (TIGR01450 family)|nr:HAD-IA family hydrolase [Holosporaceae bacterium]
MEIRKSILDLADLYDAFFVDMYGVLYDGVSLYNGTLDTMKKLRNLGKKIVILSNSTQVAVDAKLGYAQRGMLEVVHFDEVVTSGEFLYHSVTNNIKKFADTVGSNVNSVKCLFMGNGNVFDDSPINRIDDYDEADFIYVGVPRASYGSVRIDDVLVDNVPINIEDVVYQDWSCIKDSFGRRGFAEFDHILKICLQKNKVLVVANPDIFAHGSVRNSSKKVPIVTQGCIGKYYEKLGGKVVYFGKPYGGIFEYAAKFIDTNDRVAMVGDTPWTDVMGAINAGLSSVLVTTGITEEFCDQMDLALSDEEKITLLLGSTSSRMSNFTVDIHPTHVVKRFAAIDDPSD